MSETKVNPRTLVLVAISFAIVAVLGVVLFVLALPSLNESGKVQLPASSLSFAAGPAKDRAAAIDSGGPLLFSDVAGGERDIYLQHQGTDPLAGWVAFDARFPGTARACTLQWNREQKRFDDPCTPGRTIPADGTGLASYPVTIDDKEQVVIDLSVDKRRSTGTPPGTTPGTTPAR